jgi:hypothetical protein
MDKNELYTVIDFLSFQLGKFVSERRHVCCCLHSFILERFLFRTFLKIQARFSRTNCFFKARQNMWTWLFKNVGIISYNFFISYLKTIPAMYYILRDNRFEACTTAHYVICCSFKGLKGTLTRDFHQTAPPMSLIHGLKPFRIWLRIRKENSLRNCRFCARRCKWHRCDQKWSLVNHHIFLWKLELYCRTIYLCTVCFFDRYYLLER